MLFDIKIKWQMTQVCRTATLHKCRTRGLEEERLALRMGTCEYVFEPDTTIYWGMFDNMNTDVNDAPTVMLVDERSMRQHTFYTK